MINNCFEFFFCSNNLNENKFDPTGIPIVFDEETGYFEAQGLTYTSQNSIINWYYILM